MILFFFIFHIFSLDYRTVSNQWVIATTTPSTIKASYCIFEDLNSEEKGGAIFCILPNLFLNLNNTIFISCTAQMYGGAINFESFGGKSILRSICGTNCSAYLGQFLYISLDIQNNNQNDFSFLSSISNFEDDFALRHIVINVDYGFQSLIFSNLSNNRISGLCSGIFFYNSKDLSCSYTNFDKNIGEITLELGPTNGYSKISMCNFINNSLTLNENGIIQYEIDGKYFLSDCIFINNSKKLFSQKGSAILFFENSYIDSLQSDIIELPKMKNIKFNNSKKLYIIFNKGIGPCKGESFNNLFYNKSQKIPIVLNKLIKIFYNYSNDE